MDRRSFALNTALLTVPFLSGCARNRTDPSTATETKTTTETETTTPRETRTHTRQFRLSGKHVSRAPNGVDPSPYPEPEYENPYITELVTQAVNEPIGEKVVVEVPRDDHEAVEEAYPKLTGNEKGVYVEYDGEVVRILFYILE